MKSGSPNKCKKCYCNFIKTLTYGTVVVVLPVFCTFYAGMMTGVRAYLGPGRISDQFKCTK